MFSISCWKISSFTSIEKQTVVHINVKDNNCFETRHNKKNQKSHCTKILLSGYKFFFHQQTVSYRNCRENLWSISGTNLQCSPKEVALTARNCTHSIEVLSIIFSGFVEWMQTQEQPKGIEESVIDWDLVWEVICCGFILEKWQWRLWKLFLIGMPPVFLYRLVRCLWFLPFSVLLTSCFHLWYLVLHYQKVSEIFFGLQKTISFFDFILKCRSS